MLKVDSVSKSFGMIKAVENVSLRIKPGERRVLFGPSGCGKTTVLRLIAGLEKPDAGEIYLDGKVISRTGWALPPWQRRAAMVFQESALWPHMNVEENISFGMHKFAKPEKLEQMHEIMENTGLIELRSKYPHQLSGGQSRRVALARALAVKPDYLLMDEPLTNLDETAAVELLELIISCVADCQAALLYVTHNIQEVEILTAPVIRMKQGHIIKD